MPKVLAIIQTPVFGGPHNQMLNLVHPLAQQGWETVVVLPNEPGTGIERLQAANIPVRQTSLHRLRAKLNPLSHVEMLLAAEPEIRQLEALIEEEQADVVQICGLMSVHGGIAAQRRNIPIVWQLLSTFAPMPLRCLLTPYVKRVADIVMTTGVRIAHQHPGISAMGERLIPFFPPVDTQRFRFDPAQRERARAALGIPDNALAIGTIGNRNRQKAHERMIKLFAHLSERHCHLHFRILGAETPSNADYYKKHVVQLAERLNLLEDGRLQFVEPHDRVAELLPALDIFVLTSRAEGIPTAVLEAQACGIPVVSNNIGAIAEAVIDGQTGFISPSADTVTLSERIERLIQDPALRQKMGKQSREHAEAQFSIHQCVALHSQAYHMAIQHRAG